MIRDGIKILVDGYNLARPEGTGVASYSRGFVRAAEALSLDVNILFGIEQFRSALAVADPANLQMHRGQLPIIWRGRRIVGSALAGLGYRAQVFRRLEAGEGTDRIPAPATLWNSYGLFAHAIGAFRRMGVFSTVDVPGVEIAHWTYPLPIRAAGALNIYTFHDLVPLLRPDLTLDHAKHYRRLCEAVIARADHILTVSEHSRKEIIDVFGVEPGKVANLYQAHDIGERERAAASATVESACAEFGVARGEYLLFLGAIEPKKNLPRLLEAYLQSGTDTPFLLVGSTGWDLTRQLAPLDRCTPEQRARIRLIGYQPRDKVLALVKGAKATLFPSLAEGFGLPAVESMALGTPVLASNVGGLGEVAGSAALIVDPLDVGAMAEGIRALDRNRQLRSSLSRAGLAQAELFSAPAYERRVAAFFKQIRGPRGSGLGR